MTDIVMFGSGQIADVARVYLHKESDFRIVAFTVDRAYQSSDRYAGLPLVAWEDLPNVFPPSQVKLLGPISYRRLNQFRRDRYLEGKQLGYDFVSFIHPDCNIYSDDIGENCFILEKNVIQPFAHIGNNVVLWSGNHIGHNVHIGDHCFITSQVGIAGAVTIGEESYLAGKSGVIDGITIGRSCLLCPGAIATQDLADKRVLKAASASVLRASSQRFSHLF